MVVLRATQKVLWSLPETAKAGDVSETALGDWYVNRVVVDRQPLLLFVSEKSLLAALAPARSVKGLAKWFPEVVFDRLKRMNVDLPLIGSELEAMDVVRVGRTQDRSVTGQMVDFAKTLPYLLPESGWGTAELRKAEDLLARTPCRREKTIFPEDEGPRLLQVHAATKGAACN